MSELNPELRVLIVDDFESIRKILKKLLQKLDIKYIDEADDGFTAIPKIKVNTYDLVLLDWEMPKVNGLAVLKAIRSDPRTKFLPVIMVTAESIKENIIAAAKAGVNDYIVKPFSSELLEEKIKNALKRTILA